jgi:hypothetical protein
MCIDACVQGGSKAGAKSFNAFFLSPTAWLSATAFQLATALMTSFFANDFYINSPMGVLIVINGADGEDKTGN